MDQAGDRRKKSHEAKQKNQVIFGILLIVIQAIVSVAYGVVGRVDTETINIGSVLTTIFLALLMVVGFGMHFGYLKHLVWSSITFCFMITSLSILIYPLANALWGKLGLHQVSDSFSNNKIIVALANMDSINYQNNTISAGIKCALSIIIAFGSLIGRVGPLQCLILSIIGILGFQLNRSIVGGLGQDLFGTFTIFAFGGFMGLISGILLKVRELRVSKLSRGHEKRQGNNTNINQKFQSNSQTAFYSLIGNIAIFILLPFLAFQGDQTLQGTLFQRYIGPLTVVLAMSSSVCTLIAISFFIHGDKNSKIKLKDLLNAQIAGGIVSGAASYYTTTPYLGLIAGAVAAVTQYIFDNFLQQKIYDKWGIISTYSFSLNCLQSFVGWIFALAYNARIKDNSVDGFAFPSDVKNPGMEAVIYFISSGIGIGCGLIVGIFCYLLNSFQQNDLFLDKSNFRFRDGISYNIQKANKAGNFPSLSMNNCQSENPYPQSPPQSAVALEKDKQKKEQQEDQFAQELSDPSFDFQDMLQAEIN